MASLTIVKLSLATRVEAHGRRLQRSPGFLGFNANSFWNYQAICEIVGAKYPGAPLGLITVADMLPSHWSMKLVNRNTEVLDDADLDWADVVITGGIMPQQWDTLAGLRMRTASRS